MKDNSRFLVQFFDETWKVAICVLLNYDLAHTKHWVMREFNEELGHEREFAGITLACEEKDGGIVDVISIPKWDNSPRSHSILAHEALHVVFHAFRRRRVELSDEVVCYFTESIVRRVLEKIQSRKKRKSRQRS